MLEIPANVMLERLKTGFAEYEEVPDEWKTVPVLTEEQAKIYRKKVTLLRFENEFKYLSLTISGVVPVYSGKTCIGCLGHYDVSGEEIIVELLIDYATPERLELENDNPALKVTPVMSVDMWKGEPLYGGPRLVKVDLAFESNN